MDMGQWIKGGNKHSRKLRDPGNGGRYQRARSAVALRRLERHPWKPLALWWTRIRCHRKWLTWRPLGVRPQCHNRPGKPSDDSLESVDMDQGPQRGQPTRHLRFGSQPRALAPCDKQPRNPLGPCLLDHHSCANWGTDVLDVWRRRLRCNGLSWKWL